MEISIIVAINNKNVIGKNGNIPWHIPEDLKLFKKTTDNSVVIMGRKTWESIPEKFKPLPNRVNIIISSKNTLISKKDTYLLFDFEKALNFAKTFNKNIFFIGGQSVYEQSIHFADYMYISHINNNEDGDTYFNYNAKQWTEIESLHFKDFIMKKYKKNY